MRTITLTLALIGVAACSQTVKVQTDPAAGKVDVDVEKPGAPEGWNATLAVVGASGVSGTATGTAANDSTHVTINVTGATAGATLPWHVHEGKCGDANAPIVGSVSHYPTLTVGSDGRATATAHIPIKLNEAKDYIVNVHASPTNVATIVACGDFDD